MDCGKDVSNFLSKNNSGKEKVISFVLQIKIHFTQINQPIC